MSKKMLPPNKTDAPEGANDAYYSEELSRAAVGRLFDGEENGGGPPPIKSAFVTGFDRTPASGEDKNPTKKRPPLRETNERFRPRPAEEPQHLHEEEPAGEAPLERHRRRETATTRLLSGAQPDEPTDDRRDRNARRRNPAPKPAVRVNVPTEHHAQENPPPKNPRNKKNNPNEEHPSEEDLDTFRRRFNSEELVSPPRNPNRPVRGGRADVRTNRIRAGGGDSETIGPLQMVLAIVAIAVLALVTILAFQLVSFRGRYNDSVEANADLRRLLDAAENSIGIETQAYRENLIAAEAEIARLERVLREGGHETLPTNGENWGDEDGEQPPAPPQVGLPTLPTTHTVVSGDRLELIAMRYFGNRYPATQDHIVATNIGRFPTLSRDNISIGWELQITPMN